MGKILLSHNKGKEGKKLFTAREAKAIISL